MKIKLKPPTGQFIVGVLMVMVAVTVVYYFAGKNAYVAKAMKWIGYGNGTPAAA